MINIEIRGSIVSDDDKWMYEFMGIRTVSPAEVKKALEQANGEEITVQINSGGGDVFAGNEIYYLISSYKGKKIVDVIFAASAATVIACAGDTVRAVPGAQYMIHNVSSLQNGDYRDMDHMSDILKSANKAVSNTYQIKTGMTEKELLKLMDNETWMDAEKAKEYGFIDEIIGDNGKWTKPFSIYNSAAQILSDQTKERIRNAVQKNCSGNMHVNIALEQENLNLLKMKGVMR